VGAFNEDKEKSWPSTIIGESMIRDCSVCMARTIKKAGEKDSPDGAQWTYHCPVKKASVT
jgi:hypothetical protein